VLVIGSVVVDCEVSGLVSLISRDAGLSHSGLVTGLSHSQEHLEVLKTWQRGDGRLQHGLAVEEDFVITAKVHVGGQVDVVEHGVPGVSVGGAFARECSGWALLCVLFL